MRKMLAACLLLGVLPALAQPTPPPAVTAENGIIRPPYTDAPEYAINPAVPQGDIREFIM